MKTLGWVNPNPRHPEDWYSTQPRDGWVEVVAKTEALSLETALISCRGSVILDIQNYDRVVRNASSSDVARIANEESRRLQELLHTINSQSAARFK